MEYVSVWAREQFREREGAVWGLAMGILLLVAFALRVYHLDFQSFWRDEVDAVVFAREGLPSLVAKFLKIGENGPFYFTLLHYWIALAGDSEFSLRFFSTVFGVLTVSLTYVAGVRLLGRWPGLLAAGVATTSPYYVWYSQEAKMYALLAAVTLLSMYVFLRALDENRPRLWALFVIVASASFYIHFFAALVLVCQAAIFASGIWRYRDRILSFGLAAAALTLPYLPLALWQLPLLANPPASPYEFMPFGAVGTTLLFAFSIGFTGGGNVLAVTLYIFLLLSGVILWGKERSESGHRGGEAADGGQQPDRTPVSYAVGAPTCVGALCEAPTQPETSAEALRAAPTQRDSSRRWPITVLVLYLFIPLITFYAVSLRYPMFTERYLIIVLPAFQMLVGAGLYVVLRRSIVLFVGCATMMLVFSWAAISTLQNTPVKADFRAAVRYYQAHGDRNDAIMAVMPYMRRSFDYYYPHAYRWVEPPYTNQGLAEGEVATELEMATGGVKRLWLFVAEEDFWDGRALVRGWLDGHARLLDEAEFVGVRLRYYELPQ